MNKFTKLILTTAIFATSGFATTEIKQDTIYEAGMTVSLEKGTSYVFSDGVTLHNYTTIQGPTGNSKLADFKLASDATSANVIHYKDQLTKDEAFTKYSDISTGDYYRTMGEGSRTGNINVASGITETTKSEDIVASLSGIGASDTIVLVGTDNDAVSMTDDSGNVVTISQNIANEKASGDTTNSSKGLVISGKFKLNGNNSHFNQEKVSGENAEIEFSGDKSLFQSDMEFSNSKITLSQTSPITFGKSLTIQGGTFVINTPNFSFSKGSSFFLKAPAVNSLWNDLKTNGSVLKSSYDLSGIASATENGVTYYGSASDDIWAYEEGKSLIRTPNLNGIAKNGFSGVVDLYWDNQTHSGVNAFNTQVILYNLTKDGTISSAERFEPTEKDGYWHYAVNCASAISNLTMDSTSVTFVKAGESNTISKASLNKARTSTYPTDTYSGVVFFPHDQTELNTDCVFFQTENSHMQYITNNMINTLNALLNAGE